MALYLIKTTGSRTSGASDPDDWTDANCYATPSAIVEGTDDVFTFDAGTYAIAAWTISSVAVTIGTRGNGAVTLGPAASQGYVLSVQTNSTRTTTVTGITFDGSANITSAPLSLANGTTNGTINIVDCTINGSTGPYLLLLSGREGAVNITNMTVTGNIANDGIFSTSSLAEDDDYTFTADGIHFDGVTTTEAATLSLIRLSKGDFATTLTANIQRVTGSVTNSAGGVSDTITGFDLSGVNAGYIRRCNLTVSAVNATSASGFWCQVRGGAGANRITDGFEIYDNIAYCLHPAGDVISVGTDAEAGTNVTRNTLVYRNRCFGIDNEATSPHGIVFRGVSSGKAYQNDIQRIYTALMLSICDNDAVQMYSNRVENCYGRMLSFKGNSAGIMANNTCIAEKSTAVPVGIQVSEQGATANTGGKAYNNQIIYRGMTKASGMFTEGSASDSLTAFSHNNYFIDSDVPVGAWENGATSYNTLAAWKAAVETVAYDEESEHQGLSKGLKWWSGRAPRDFDGQEFLDVPSIGATEQALLLFLRRRLWAARRA